MHGINNFKFLNFILMAVPVWHIDEHLEGLKKVLLLGVKTIFRLGMIFPCGFRVILFSNLKKWPITISLIQWKSLFFFFIFWILISVVNLLSVSIINWMEAGSSEALAWGFRKPKATVKNESFQHKKYHCCLLIQLQTTIIKVFFY